MKYLKHIYLLFALVIFSCEKVIELDVNNIEDKLVIDAEYIATENLVRVKLSETKDVFSAEDFTFISGAQVEIVDANGVPSSLTDLGNGIYELTNYTPVYNSSYTLKLIYKGEIYQSSDFLNAPVELKTLISDFEEESLFGAEGYVVYMNFIDPNGPNFYRAVRYVNGKKLTNLGDQFVFDDGFSEGNEQIVPFFTDRYEVGDSIAVEFRSYSEKTYTYVSELFDIAGDSGQSAAPANPNSTWTNGALGNFAAYGYDLKSIVIEE